MDEKITLRPATTEDADILLEWRNDLETRKSSKNTAKVHRSDHVSWLSRTIGHPNSRLYVAEENGDPVGTVRADFSDGVWELSWTVCPRRRGRGVAKRMVAVLTSEISAPIRAEVKTGNTSSARIAEHAGMVFERETDGILHYSRASLR